MYYLHLNGAKAGPYTRDQIEGMIASNQISSGTLAWKEGQTEWQPWRELFPLAASDKRVIKLALALFGVGVIVMASLLGGLYAYVEYWGMKTDQSSKAYVDEAIPAILKEWSLEELSKRESPALRRAIDDQARARQFEQFRVLGPLVEYKGSKGESILEYPWKWTAKYVALATCKNGEAEIQVNLIWRQGGWQIYYFKVDSPGESSAED